MKTKKLRNGLNNVWNFVKQGAVYVIPVITAIVANYVKEQPSHKIRYIGNVGYGEAVDAVSQSDMFSAHKVDAIKLIKRDETSDYYKAIIAIINSEMFSTHKVSAIKDLNVEEE